MRIIPKKAWFSFLGGSGDGGGGGCVDDFIPIIAPDGCSLQGLGINWLVEKGSCSGLHQQ